MKRKTKNLKQKKIKIVVLICLVCVLFLSLLMNGNTNYNYEQANRNTLNMEIQISSNDSPEEQWYKTWGGNGSDFCNDIVLDSFDNIYLAGYTSSFGAGWNDIVLVKYNSSGQQQWNTTWGGNDDDKGRSVASDSSDNIYLAGYTSSFGAGGYDMVLAKYNALGEQQWNTTWGGSDDDEGRSIALDSAENIFIAGITYSFGAGWNDIVLVKYNSSGQQQWNTTWGGNGSDFCNDIVLDSFDNIYLAGYTRSFGAGWMDIVLVKYNSSGQQQWNTTWGGSNDDVGWATALDSSENIYLAGYTRSFGAGGYDMVLAKYNALGEQQWITTRGGSTDDAAFAITLDSSDNIFITGFTWSFDAGLSDINIVLAKYNSLCEQQWYATWGGSNEDYGFAIALDSSDNIFIAGRTESFGAGGEDIVLIKYGKSSVDNGLAPIPGYDLFLLLGAICVISTIIVKRRHKSQ